MPALTLTQAQDERSRIISDIENRQVRLAELNEYIDVLKQQEFLASKKTALVGKGTLDGVRF